MQLTRLLLVGAILSATINVASAQAYCALRDPVRGIHKVYPKAETFRSIVRTIDERVRQNVAKELPFTLHFNELGRHTLYVATRDSRPIGLVHVRSEQGTWGMVEIAWAFDIQLRVTNFVLQRCRSRQRQHIKDPAFKKQLVGKDFATIRAMLSKDGKHLKRGAITVDPAATDLAVTIVRSCLKTMAATRHGWAQELDLLNVLDHAYTAFPGAKHIEQIRDVYNPMVFGELDRHLDSGGKSNLEAKSALLVRVRDGDQNVVGWVLRSRWRSMGREVVLWWNVTPDLRIKDVIPEGGWPSKDIELAFRKVRGMTFKDVPSCATSAQVVGAEALVVVRTHENLAQPQPPK